MGVLKSDMCWQSGVMGVPITFLNKFNPDQFEIVEFRKGDDVKDFAFSEENTAVLSNPYSTSIPGMTKNSEGTIDGKITYARITIRRKRTNYQGDYA